MSRHLVLLVASVLLFSLLAHAHAEMDYSALMPNAFAKYEPQQIHLSLTDKEDEMTVMWLTNEATSAPTVQWGSSPTSLTSSAKASSANKHYDWLLYRSGAINTAMMTGLAPSSTYYYRVGSASEQWSQVYSFKTSNREYPLRIIIAGDVGSTEHSWKTIDNMIKLNQQKPVDFVMHSGDISYANGEQKYWDIWQNKVQPLTATTPYMVTVGNHEAISLFIPYLKRFAMPFGESGGIEGNMFYSFTYGPVHFIGLSSESVVFNHFLPQYFFLKSDLNKVDRKHTPWLFSSWHRPMYCANTIHQDSDRAMRESYEKILYKNKLDISFTGHVHAAEITKPIYNGTVVEDGIITVVQGNGGNHEGLYDHWLNPLPDWAQNGLYDGKNYGFGLMTIYNETTLHYENLDENLGTVYDLWVTRKR